MDCAAGEFPKVSEYQCRSVIQQAAVIDDSLTDVPNEYSQYSTSSVVSTCEATADHVTIILFGPSDIILLFMNHFHTSLKWTS